MKPRVLILIPSLGTGGAERSATWLSRVLQERYDVTLISFDESTKIAFASGGHHKSMGIGAGRNFPHKLSQFARRVRWLHRLKAEIKPYASISFLEGANYINLLSQVGERTIISVRGSKLHDQNLDNALGQIRRFVLVPTLYRAADDIVTISKGLATELQQRLRLRSVPIHIIHNGIEVAEVRRRGEEPLAMNEDTPRWLAKGPVISVHGRLAREKGFDHAIRIFKGVKERLPNARLIVVGDGPEKRRLQKIAEQLRLKTCDATAGQRPEAQHDVLFTGMQVNPMNWVRQAKLSYCTSLHEGFGNSIVEALALGVPVLAADCPYGPREILASDLASPQLSGGTQGRGGILFPPLSRGRYQPWIEHTHRLLTDTQAHAQLCKAAEVRAQNFSSNVATRKWLQLLDRSGEPHASHDEHVHEGGREQRDCDARE